MKLYITSRKVRWFSILYNLNVKPVSQKPEAGADPWAAFRKAVFALGLSDMVYTLYEMSLMISHNNAPT